MDLTDAVEALPEPVVEALARRLAPVLREHLAEDHRCSCADARPRESGPEGTPPVQPRTSLPRGLADDVWFTTAEAAEYSRRHPTTVRIAAASGVLESTSSGRGRHRRYRKEWIDTWTAQRGRLRG